MSVCVSVCVCGEPSASDQLSRHSHMHLCRVVITLFGSFNSFLHFFLFLFCLLALSACLLICLCNKCIWRHTQRATINTRRWWHKNAAPKAEFMTRKCVLRSVYNSPGTRRPVWMWNDVLPAENGNAASASGAKRLNTGQTLDNVARRRRSKILLSCRERSEELQKCFARILKLLSSNAHHKYAAGRHTHTLTRILRTIGYNGVAIAVLCARSQTVNVNPQCHHANSTLSTIRTVSRPAHRLNAPKQTS